MIVRASAPPCHRWTLVDEIGVARAGDRSVRGVELVGPVAVQPVDGESLLVLDRHLDDARLVIVDQGGWRVPALRGLRSTDTMIKSITAAPDGYLVVAGDDPREVSFVDRDFRVRRRLWSSDRGSAMNWPAYALPFGDGVLVGDQSKHTPTSYRRAGLILLTRDGEIVWEWRPGKGVDGVGEPTHLAIGLDGSIVVTDAELHRVVAVEPPGRILWTHGRCGTPGGGTGELACPTAATVTPEGTILVSDTRNHRLVELSHEGRFVRSIGGRGDEVGGSPDLDCPSMAFVAGDGAIVVADTGNQRIAEVAHGSVRTVAGRVEPDRRTLSFPRSVQSLSQSSWLVADTNNNRVVTIHADGRVLSMYGGPEAEPLRWPRCAHRSSTEETVIADGANSRVLVIGPDGSVRLTLDSIRLGRRRVPLDDPHQIVATGRGTYLLVDSRLALVAEIGLDGRAIRWFWPENGVPLSDPHQVAMAGGHLYVADPDVGIVRVELQSAASTVITTVRASTGEDVELHQPKAVHRHGEALVIANCFAPLRPVVVLDGERTRVIAGLDGHAAGAEGRLDFHNPRSFDSGHGGRIVVSDFEAHRLLVVEAR